MLILAARSPQPWLIIGFALAGLFLSVFYVAPPFSLKRHGLGELDVFLTWGPLMIGGVYLVATGSVPLWVLAFSAPYALLVTSVLFGKHIDKIEPDTKLGIRTLPVILGERLARRTNQALMIAFYPLLVLAVALGWAGPWVLLAVLAIPELLRALRFYNEPKPAEPPAWYPARGWPLWFVGFAFRHVRLAGGLLTLGLLINVFLPIRLPWL
jgi:1,4-dihydroxy-2-naphthoate octaprenyltransferase